MNQYNPQGFYRKPGDSPVEEMTVAEREAIVEWVCARLRLRNATDFSKTGRVLDSEIMGDMLNAEFRRVWPPVPAALLAYLGRTHSGNSPRAPLYEAIREAITQLGLT